MKTPMLEGFRTDIPMSKTTVVIAGIIVYFISLITYRINFHPLAQYPGPLLGKITNWYSVYHAWKGDRHLDFFALHETYGEVVRFGPNQVSMSSVNALREIYSLNTNSQKAKFYKVFELSFDPQSVVSIIDKRLHASSKRIFSQAFTAAAIKNLEGHILKNVQTFCNLLPDEPDRTQEWGSAKNMADWFHRLTFDAMGDFAFGRSWNLLSSEHNRELGKIFTEAAAGLYIIGHMPWILMMKLEHIFFRKQIKGQQKFRAVSKAQSDARITDNDDFKKKDLFGILMDAEDPETGRRFTTKELVSQGGEIIFAASDTMTTVMSSTMFYLLHYPNILVKVQAEIRTRFESADDILIGPDLKSCRYLRACIDEALRMNPPLGSPLLREVLAGGCWVDGHYLPAGTDVGVPTYTIQHRKEYFKDPFSFDPLRWIVDADTGVTKEDVALARSAFCPFSRGARACPGKALAYPEMMIVLARMIFLLDFRLQEGSKLGEGDPHAATKGRARVNEFQTRDNFTSSQSGPMVEFRPRKLHV